jgi:hypothetical protein
VSGLLDELRRLLLGGGGISAHQAARATYDDALDVEEGPEGAEEAPPDEDPRPLVERARELVAQAVERSARESADSLQALLDSTSQRIEKFAGRLDREVLKDARKEMPSGRAYLALLNDDGERASFLDGFEETIQALEGYQVLADHCAKDGVRLGFESAPDIREDAEGVPAKSYVNLVVSGWADWQVPTDFDFEEDC